MTQKKIETAVLVDHNRHFPLTANREYLQALDASGVVDEIMITDQLTSWFPRDMWTVENTGLAAIAPDIDSFPDPFVAAALALTATKNIGISLATDCVRRGPAELMQSMLTLANLGGERSITLQMGAGERKQTVPFGWPQKQGLKRFQDHFRFRDAFWNTSDPVNMEGEVWSFSEAWIGGAKGKKPRVFGLGAGPKLLDLTMTYADGFATSIPSTWPNAEVAAERISDMRRTLEAKDRNPDDFKIGGWMLVALHDEGEEHLMDLALNNLLFQWFGIIFGRFPHGAWETEGFPSPISPDWHYSTKYEPIRWNVQEIREITRKVSAEQYRRCVFAGTPAQVAEQLKPFVEAGVNWLMPTDLMNFILKPEQLPDAARRGIELCALLKQMG